MNVLGIRAEKTHVTAVAANIVTHCKLEYFKDNEIYEKFYITC